MPITPNVTNKYIYNENIKIASKHTHEEFRFNQNSFVIVGKQKQQEMNKNKEIIVLNHKRSNAINIGMTKLPPPRSIKTAILKMDATIMNREGIEVRISRTFFFCHICIRIFIFSIMNLEKICTFSRARLKHAPLYFHSKYIHPRKNTRVHDVPTILQDFRVKVKITFILQSKVN